MPDICQIAVKSRGKLRIFRVYLSDKERKRHKNVVLDKPRVWNLAPTDNFTDWMDAERKRYQRRRRRGRPISWGTWYILTFPNGTKLREIEKQQYEAEMIRQLDPGASGILVWHNKLLGSHDLNMLVSPIARYGELRWPRRNREDGEFRRLQRTSDVITVKFNRERKAENRPEIETMPATQAKYRRKNKRKTLAETLAENNHFQALVAAEQSKPGTLSHWKKTITKALDESKHEVKKWDEETWSAQIHRPGLRNPQWFSMLQIAGEAAILVRAKLLAQQKRKATQPPPKPPLPSLTLPELLDIVVKHRKSKRPFRKHSDLIKALESSELTVMTDGCQTNDDHFAISNFIGDRISVQKDSFLFAANCRLLRVCLSGMADSEPVRQFCHQLQSLTHLPASQPAYAIPCQGEFWQEAFNTTNFPNLRKYWKQTLDATGSVGPIETRLEEIRESLQGKYLSDWSQFVVLLAHCDNAPQAVVNRFLTEFQASRASKNRQHLLVQAAPEHDLPSPESPDRPPMIH